MEEIQCRGKGKMLEYVWWNLMSKGFLWAILQKQVFYHNRKKIQAVFT